MTPRRTAAHRRRLGRGFTRLWIGFTLASSGDGLLVGAVPLLAVVVNPHPFAVSAVIAADKLPWLLLALPAGHLADRFDRARVANMANFVRALAMVAAVALIATDTISLGFLIVVVLLNAGGRTVYYSAFQAMVPSLVDTRDLEQANGVLTGTEASAEDMAGPIAGSALFALARVLPFVADVFVYLASCLPLLGFHSRSAKEEVGTSTGSSEEAGTSSGSMWEGVRLLFADHRLRLLVIMVASLSGLQGMESGVLVLLATTEWGVRQGAYGLFLAAGSLGGVVGSFVADNIVRRIGGARLLIVSAVASGVGYLLMGSAGSWVLAAPAFALVCFAIGTGSVTAVSLRQRLTPDQLMGRVGSAWRGLVWGAAPLGALAAGALAAVHTLATPLLLAGVLQCAVAAVLALPLLRHLNKGALMTERRSAG